MFWAGSMCYTKRAGWAGFTPLTGGKQVDELILTCVTICCRVEILNILYLLFVVVVCSSSHKRSVLHQLFFSVSRLDGPLKWPFLPFIAQVI